MRSVVLSKRQKHIQKFNEKGLSFFCSQSLYILEWNKRLYITENGKGGQLE